MKGYQTYDPLLAIKCGMGNYLCTGDSILVWKLIMTWLHVGWKGSATGGIGGGVTRPASSCLMGSETYFRMR